MYMSVTKIQKLSVNSKKFECRKIAIPRHFTNVNVKIQKIFGPDYVTKENIKEHNPNWPQIFDHWYIMFIIGGSESRKKNALLNLINHKP